MRTGKEYLASLRDGRRVYVGGELIEDITTHPKTRGYAHAIAEYYDLHLDPRNLPRIHDCRRGNGLRNARRPIQAKQHLCRFRPRLLPGKPA